MGMMNGHMTEEMEIEKNEETSEIHQTPPA